MGRPPKRKVAEVAKPESLAGNRQKTSGSAKKRQKTHPATSSARPTRNSLNTAHAPRLTRSASNAKGSDVAAKKSLPKQKKIGRPLKKAVGRPKKASSRASAPAAKREPSVNEDDENSHANISIAVPLKDNKPKSMRETKKKDEAVEESEDEADADGHQYWLMKAEPESRIEKGKDVKFSIDDLKVATSPEPWDGVRNLEARNNMRAMTKGDMAFFYHSNCKLPGIVGIMEIVQEHSIDESAFDPEHPYYDDKSSRENPKWHLVHVAFRQKFPEIITLKELQKFSKQGGILESMQTLKRTRLSVSKVSKKEWDFILGLVDVEDVATANA